MQFLKIISRILKKEFNIQGIPSLIVVKKDGTVVSTNGRSDVERRGSLAYKDWSKWILKCGLKTFFFFKPRYYNPL